MLLGDMTLVENVLSNEKRITYNMKVNKNMHVSCRQNKQMQIPQLINARDAYSASSSVLQSWLIRYFSGFFSYVEVNRESKRYVYIYVVSSIDADGQHLRREIYVSIFWRI
jgi:hypothetical protein